MPHRNKELVAVARMELSQNSGNSKSILGKVSSEEVKVEKILKSHGGQGEDTEGYNHYHLHHYYCTNGVSKSDEILKINPSKGTNNGYDLNSQNHHHHQHHPHHNHPTAQKEENGQRRSKNGNGHVNGHGKNPVLSISSSSSSSCHHREKDSEDEEEDSDSLLNLSLHQLKHDLTDFDYDSEMDRPKKIYKVVLTGGPCGGKTTGQARLCTFFENLGWKVFRVPEAATILLSGGIKFTELSEEQALLFQEHLLRTMMQIETVFFRMAETVNRDVLVICDRGAMDASAFIPRSKWEGILNRNGWNEVELRDTRYNQIIHMVSAANGAEPFYTIEDHSCRTEGLELARELDRKAAQSWVGHPYFDVVDNSTDFETKLCRMIQSVCQKLGIDARDRLQTNSKKVKFLVSGPLPDNKTFPIGFQDFTVVHDYLQTSSPKMQARLRKRGQKGNWSYTYTVRRPELQGQVVEVKTALTQRDYNNMLAQRDHDHVTVYKTRRCFLLNDQYFQLDLYEDPCHPRCKGMILLETYSTLNGAEIQQRLPTFLNIQAEVTGDPRYSMFNLSLKERWLNNTKFCQSLAGAEEGVEVSKNESRLAGWGTPVTRNLKDEDKMLCVK